MRPKDIKQYEKTSSIVELVKEHFSIHKPNDAMTDPEIKEVCRWFGEHAPDFDFIDGKPVFGREGIEAMVFIALTEFPEYYKKYELSPID